MSLTGRRIMPRTLPIWIAAAIVLMALAIIRFTDDHDPPSPTPTPFSQPKNSLTILRATTPSQAALQVSKLLYRYSEVAVAAPSNDQSAQTRAAKAAQRLRVPILLSDEGDSAELERLGVRHVLTFGSVPALDHAVPVGASENDLSDAIAYARRFNLPKGPGPRRFLVVDDQSENLAAVTTARNTGAIPVELPSADARDAPGKAFAESPDTPIVAVGDRFANGFRYTATVVRQGIEQPSGGYRALPGKHYAALYGHPGTSNLGVLGEQGVKASVQRVKRLAKRYRAVSGTSFVPTFEIIATVASSVAGKDKNYSTEFSVRSMLPLVDAAERAGIYVVLDLQPGRSDFLTQAKRYAPLLRKPHVGLALDPEWRLTAKQKHLTQIGSVQADEINRVSTWLAKLTRENQLPQKLFVLHQFSTAMIKDRHKVVTDHREFATVIHVDGQGTQPAKQGTWTHLRRGAPRGVFWGWKNFIDEDRPMLSAAKTWTHVKPHPALVTYQ